MSANGQQLASSPLLITSSSRSEPVKFAEAGASGKVVGTEKIEDRTYTVVELETPKERDRLYFDAQSGLLYKAHLENRVSGFGVAPVEVTYEDYREVNGVKFPFSITSITTVDRIHLKVSEIQTNLTEDPSKFEPPPKPAASQ
jgi:zinc protease